MYFDKHSAQNDALFPWRFVYKRHIWRMTLSKIAMPLIINEPVEKYDGSLGKREFNIFFILSLFYNVNLHPHRYYYRYCIRINCHELLSGREHLLSNVYNVELCLFRVLSVQCNGDNVYTTIIRLACMFTEVHVKIYKEDSFIFH